MRPYGRRSEQWARILAALEAAPIGFKLVHLHPQYEMLVTKIEADRVQIVTIPPKIHGLELTGISYDEYVKVIA
jgi:hypothetical protein